MLINAIKFDPSAIGSDSLIITVVGYVVVFVALGVLFAMFFYLPKLLAIRFKPRKKADGTIDTTKQAELSVEVNAAISVALHLYFNQFHDEESYEMTIKRESRIYSPWSSKIYQVRHRFNRV
jgi:Na+-transporting methylmalonyl-CoA/oxaloacetate decarboxylase gamma subunit